MTKDVIVSVRGAHVGDSDSSNLEIITVGSYYLKNGKHYVIYDEAIEGESESIHTTIRVGEDSVDMIKSGDIRAHMVFKENYSDQSSYVSPFGQIMIGVTTDKIKINEEQDHLKIGIDYTLKLNQEKISNSHIEIDVKSKMTAKLHLKD